MPLNNEICTKQLPWTLAVHMSTSLTFTCTILLDKTDNWLNPCELIFGCEMLMISRKDKEPQQQNNLIMPMMVAVTVADDGDDDADADDSDDYAITLDHNNNWCLVMPNTIFTFQFHEMLELKCLMADLTLLTFISSILVVAVGGLWVFVVCINLLFVLDQQSVCVFGVSLLCLFVVVFCW